MQFPTLSRQRPAKAAATNDVADESKDPADLGGRGDLSPSLSSGPLSRKFIG